MDPTLAPLAGPSAAALLQLPAVFDTTLGQTFLGLVAFLAVAMVARVLLRIAWKVALIAAVAVGAFLVLRTFVPVA